MKNKIFWGSFALCTLAFTLSIFGFGFGDFIPGGGGGGGGDEADAVTGFSGVGIDEEMNIGGSLAVEIAAKEGGILKDEVMTRRVATIGKALTLYSTRSDPKRYPWMFAVLNSDEINAVSAPGGYVFVTKGLVKACKNDNQLAGVLAHEISHVTQRHALRVLSGGKSAKGASLILGGALGIAGVDTYGAEGALGSAIKGLISKGLPKADEYDADKMGTLLVRDTGFPPRTLRDFLDAMKDQDPDKTFSKHPKTEDRVDRLDDQLKDMGK